MSFFSDLQNPNIVYFMAENQACYQKDKTNTMKDNTSKNAFFFSLTLSLPFFVTPLSLSFFWKSVLIVLHHSPQTPIVVA